MTIEKISPSEFRAALEDGRGRVWYVTFARTYRGMVPTVKRIEREQGNGRFDFVTLYRPSCHGDLPTIIVEAIKGSAKAIRAM